MGKQMTEMLKGTLEGIVLAVLAVQPAYGYEITARLAGAGLLRPRRGHRLRAAGPDRAARLRRRGEGPVREGAAAQGVLAQRAGAANSSRSSGGRWSFLAERIEQLHHDRTPAGRRRELSMAAKWIETLTGSLEQKKQYKQDKARIDALPEPYGTAAKAMHRYFMYYGGITDGDTLMHDVRRLRRPVGARRRRRDAGARDRRRRPGRVRRDLRAGLLRQAVDRQGARPPDQGDRGRGARGAEVTTDTSHPGAGHREVVQGPARAARRRLRRDRRGASSRCSARTAPARPRSCASCRRC